MSTFLKSVVLLFSLFAIHWGIVWFDNSQNTIDHRPYIYNGLQTRKLLSANSTTQSSSDQATPGKDETTAKPCIEFHMLSNTTQRCSFIKTENDCQMSDGFFQYLQFPYCTIPKVYIVAFILMGLWLIFLFVTLGITADEYFCPSLTVIYKTLKISENIAGVTFLAYGNGSPDIFSAVAVFSGSRGGDAAGLAINGLLGAGMFVTTIVVGAVSFTEPFTLTYRPFTRDVLFYLGAVTWAFITFHKGRITLYEAIGYIMLYVAYVLTVVVGRYIYQRWKPKLRFLGNTGCLFTSGGLEESLQPSGSWLRNSQDSDVAVNINRCPGDRRRLIDSQSDDKPLKKNERHDLAGALLATEYTAVSFVADVKVKPPSPVPDVNTPLLDTGKPRTLTPWMKFWKGVQPWDDTEWKNAGKFGKAFIIFKSPAILCLNLTVPVVDLNEDDQLWNKWLNVFHCLVDPVFCIFITRHGYTLVGNVFPLWALMLAFGIILALIVALSTSDETPPRCHRGFAFIAFVVSVIWIYTTANEIVNLLQTFGYAFKISNGILGLTFLAWGNSIGDFIADLTMARQGFPRMAISACFGGPLLNLLLGIGLACTVATVRSGNSLSLHHNHNQYIISAGFLALSLASSAIFIPLMGFKIPRPYGVYLILLYISYLTISIAEEVWKF